MIHPCLLSDTPLASGPTQPRRSASSVPGKSSVLLGNVTRTSRCAAPAGVFAPSSSRLGWCSSSRARVCSLVESPGSTCTTLRRGASVTVLCMVLSTAVLTRAAPRHWCLGLSVNCTRVVRVPQAVRRLPRTAARTPTQPHLRLRGITGASGRRRLRGGTGTVRAQPQAQPLLATGMGTSVRVCSSHGMCAVLRAHGKMEHCRGTAA